MLFKDSMHPCFKYSTVDAFVRFFNDERQGNTGAIKPFSAFRWIYSSITDIIKIRHTFITQDMNISVEDIV